MDYVVVNGEYVEIFDRKLFLRNKKITDIKQIENLDQLTDLEVLDLSRNEINEISGLDDLFNLTELYLSHNNITEIKNLGMLGNLQTLYLDNNRIRKINGLDNLYYLEDLYLTNNVIDKIEALGSLKSLKYLHLSQNNINEINNLDENSNLEELYLSYNQISKIEGLDSLVNLERLFLDENEILKIEGLGNNISLKELSLDKNRIIEIEGLENLNNLESFYINQNKIKEIKGLDSLGNLEMLYLSENNILRLEGLEKLRKLTFLDLEGNKIKKIENLDKNIEIEILNLSNNNIVDIDELEGFDILIHLDLSSNNIKIINGLDNLYALKYLNFSGNEISRIENLTNLRNLEELILAKNDIFQLEGLDTNVNLIILDLPHNRLERISGINNLKKLQDLNLRNNKIKEIESLNKLNSLEDIDLDLNPLSPQEEYKYRSSEIWQLKEYCKMKEIGKIIPLLNFKYEEYDLNIEKFERDLQKIEDREIFLNIGTHDEIPEIKAKQHVTFLETPAKPINLMERKFFAKDLIIHLLQLHSLKGIKPESKDNIDFFKKFINTFWDKDGIKNNVLIYNHYFDRISNKIKEFLDISVKGNGNKPDLIVFPENSIPYKLIDYLKDFSKDNNILIVGGLEHKKLKKSSNYINQAIIIDKGFDGYQIKQTPVFIKKENLIENIECASLPEINVFETSLGRIAIFICKDFLRLSEIIPKWADDDHNSVDFIIIPSLTSKVLPFHAKLLNIFNYTDNKSLKIIFGTTGEYGGSEFFSIKQISQIEESFKDNKRDNAGEIIVVRKYKVIGDKYQYDFAFSCAGEDRDKVRKIAESLIKKGVKVFYDEFFSEDLIGKDLSNYFKDVYGKNSKFVVVFVSKNYVVKEWTNFEFQYARDEAKKREEDFVIPIKLDNTILYGLKETIAYLDYNQKGTRGISDLLIKKLESFNKRHNIK